MKNNNANSQGNMSDDSASSHSINFPIWEDFIALNSNIEPNFLLLKNASNYYEGDSRKEDWRGLDFADALLNDIFPLPTTEDREGYYGANHFSYWASGLFDARHLVSVANKYGLTARNYLDFGCASGRVIRHMALENPSLSVMGCDINRLHVEWCNANLPSNCVVFQNHSIPTLPLGDNSIDLISAYSVFTHIEALETAWLMELRRVLRPGGIAWITVHTEQTLIDMNENWPLWAPVMTHPQAGLMLDQNRNFSGDRLVLRWRSNRSYSSNIFYKTVYLQNNWSRFFEILEVRRRFPTFQDVLILKKSF